MIYNNIGPELLDFFITVCIHGGHTCIATVKAFKTYAISCPCKIKIFCGKKY